MEPGRPTWLRGACEVPLYCGPPWAHDVRLDYEGSGTELTDLAFTARFISGHLERLTQEKSMTKRRSKSESLPEVLPKCRPGIKGLDEITGGGLPRIPS
jgi:hypothetical protein